jgi:hypothetical protein
VTAPAAAHAAATTGHAATSTAAPAPGERVMGEAGTADREDRSDGCNFDK